MGINGLNSLFNLFKSSQRFEQKFLQVMDKLSKTSKRVHSPRITFDRHNIPELGEAFTEITHGLKNPRITAGLNCGKGQSIMGLRIQDGDEIVGHFAFSLRQNTGGSPSLQTKLQILNHEQKAISGSSMINPNGSTKGDIISAFSSRGGKIRVEQGRGDAIHFDAFLNPEQAESFAQLIGGKTSELAKNLRQIQAHPNKFLNQVLTGYTKEAENLATTTTKATKGASKAPKASKATKPITQAKSVNERTFATEVEQIMKFEGNPTVESANKAKDILMRRMGYDPSLVTVRVADDIAGCGGCYNTATGEVLLDASMASKATHFDVADVLAHELDHMDVAVKTAKSIGLDKFERLIMHRRSADDLDIVFNRAFYEKAIAQADITGFNVKPFLQEEKQLNRLFDRNLTGQYSTIMHKYQYAISTNEGHARDVEKRLIAELQRRGIKINSSIPLTRFGRTPHQEIIDAMPKIEAKLAKYPMAQRNAKYNEAYFKALEEVNPEFARLEYKLLTEGRLNEKIERFDGTVEIIGEGSRHRELYTQLFLGPNGENLKQQIFLRTIQLI